MARVPDEELQRIKSQVAVEDLCRDYGIELRRTGPDNLMGLCPFHEDHDPSFGVTPSKNLWNCLAGCGGGDVIALVMRKEGVSFRRAVDILRQHLGIVPEDPTIETRSGTTHSMLVPPSETELADHALLGHVLDFYHQTFCDDPKAMKYLQQRRCFDPEAVKLFKIGY
jgi:DNA primase